MARVRAVFLAPFVLSAGGLWGCPAPPTALARAQQTALELNQDLRFGRTELVMEHVAPATRPAFAAQHRAWGTGVRVADVELTGLQPHNDHELDVFVRVAWYRAAEQELRTTTLQQSWRDNDGWQLMSERRIEGDAGLLGEPVVYQQPEGTRIPIQFPTVRLSGGAGGTGADEIK